MKAKPKQKTGSEGARERRSETPPPATHKQQSAIISQQSVNRRSLSPKPMPTPTPLIKTPATETHKTTLPPDPTTAPAPPAPSLAERQTEPKLTLEQIAEFAAKVEGDFCRLAGLSERSDESDESDKSDTVAAINHRLVNPGGAPGNLKVAEFQRLPRAEQARHRLQTGVIDALKGLL
jgi:hypothetical protein